MASSAQRIQRQGRLLCAIAFVAGVFGGCTSGDRDDAATGPRALETSRAAAVAAEPIPACGTGAHDKHGMDLKLDCGVCHVCGGRYEFSSSYTLPVSGQTLAGGQITRGTTPGTATCTVACHGLGMPAPQPVGWTPSSTPFACTQCHTPQAATSASSAHYPSIADPTENRAACQGCHVLRNHLQEIAIIGGDGSVLVVDRNDPASVGSSCMTCHGGQGRLVGGNTPPLLEGYAAGGGDWHGARQGSGFGGTLAAPYARGQGALNCIACHDAHVSGNAFLFASSVNGGGVAPGQVTRAGVGAEAICTNCHQGNRHAGCMTSGCHTVDPAPAGRPCFFCHGHEGTVNFTMPSWAFHPDGGKPQAFCDHCHTTIDSGGTAHWMPQTVESVPPVISNLMVRNSTGTSATVAWTTNEPASSYVEWGTDAPTRVQGSPSAVATHEVTLTGLTPATTYVYRVRTADVFRNSTRSATASFTTPQPGAPPTPVLTPTPAIATMTEPVAVTFRWSAVTSPLGKPIQYRIQISEFTDFRTTLRDVLLTPTSYTTDLMVNGYYYWRVLATDGTIASPWSAYETTFLYWDW